MPIETLFENEDLLVVEKPHGCLTTPARQADDPRPCLGRELQLRVRSQIFPVHRLDFEVGGLVIFAKTKGAHTQTQKWFEESTVRKTYQALSQAGSNPPREWTEWRSKLVKGKRRAFEGPHGKEARTMARHVREQGGAWLWELMPLTGRAHQLRFEMAKHGFPIVGDILYGGAPARQKDWIGLRAVELDFTEIPEADRLGLPPKLRTADLQAP